MKTNRFFLIIISVLIMVTGCKPKPEEPQPDPQPTPTYVDHVDWQVSTDLDKSQSMSLVICPEGEMMSVADTVEDRVSVWADGVCIGLSGVRQLEVGYRVYFLMAAPMHMNHPLEIRYFSKGKRAIYSSMTELLYESDAIVGTTDQPMVVMF